MKLWRRATAGAVVTAALVGCGILSPDLDTTGTIELHDTQVGCWVIRTSDRVLQPINLTAQFKVDGLPIRFTADFRKDLEGFCVGEIIELKSIERL